MSSKPSTDFVSILNGLLKKDPTERSLSVLDLFAIFFVFFALRRLGWEGLVVDPFWQGALQHLTQDLDTSTDLRQSVQQSIANFSARNSVTSQYDLPKGNSVLGQIHDIQDMDRPGEELIQHVYYVMPLSPKDTASTLRPLTAPGSGDPKVSFILRFVMFTQRETFHLLTYHLYRSSRPTTGLQEDNDDHLSATSPQKRTQRLTCNPSDDRLSGLIFHDSDFTITAIVDNPKVFKTSHLY